MFIIMFCVAVTDGSTLQSGVNWFEKKSDSEWKTCNESDSEKQEKSCHSARDDFHGTQRKFTSEKKYMCH